MHAKSYILVFALACLNQSVRGNLARQIHPDVGLNVAELITKYGYPFETHTVVTEDGYILDLHRIPYGREGNNGEARPAVFLMPGLFCTSADWVNMGPTSSLGFFLSNNGYDVWLGNYRGTTWGRKHVTLDPDKDKKEFWSNSFQQIGHYDAAAHIDYIIAATGQEKIFYVGHSQGTTSFFALASSRPEYNDKLRFAGVLSPPVYMHNSDNLLFRIIARLLKPIQELTDKYQFYELLPHNALWTLVGQLFCNDDSPFQKYCAEVLFIVAGRNEEQLNKTTIPVIVSNTPAGASVRQFEHYAQLHLAGTFQKYDYGEQENLEKYGQSTPPEYDLSQITVPLAVYYGDNDVLVSPEDVEELAPKLKSLVSLKLVKNFNHLDFMWAIDVVPLLYNHLLESMANY